MVLQQKIASPGHGILAMDESNATCGKRLDSIGLENTEANRQACSASPKFLLATLSLELGPTHRRTPTYLLIPVRCFAMDE